MPETLELALSNLSSAPVLAFVLGLLLVTIKSNLSIPTQIVEFLSVYLLLAIGIKGGVALHGTQAGSIGLPIALSVAVGAMIPIVVFVILRYVTRLNELDRGAIAAHYGSTSLVTFTAGLVFIEQSGLQVEAFLPALLAVMEVPGIIIGIMLAKKAAMKNSMGLLLSEVFTGKSVVLLIGGILIGLATGPTGYTKIEPFFGSLFTGMLTIFLLQLGIQAGASLKQAKSGGFGLVAFAIVFPFVAGTFGLLAAKSIDLSQGGAIAFALLCASASYIAAPAAVKLSLPEANAGYYIPSALGITFPINLIFGIPWLAWIASLIY